MRMKLMAAAVVLLVGICGSHASGLKGEKIVCIGDGITRGLEGGITRGSRWVDLLAKRTGAKVINAGRQALDTREMDYMKEVLENNRDASRFLIFVGVNDFVGVKGIDSGAAASAAARVARIIMQIHKASPKAMVWVIAPPRISADALSKEWKSKSFGPHTEVMSDLLAASLRVAAQSAGARYLSLLDEVGSEFLADGVKPGLDGHERIAQIVSADLELATDQNIKVIYAPQKDIAPPAAGRPVIDEDGAVAVAESVASDLRALSGPESANSRNEISGGSLKEPKAPRRGSVIEYVSDSDGEGVVSEEGAKLAQGTVAGIVKGVEAELDWQEASGVESVYDGVIRPTAQEQVRVAYELPPLEGERAYITAIVTPDGDAGVLGEVVDWSAVEGPEETMVMPVEKVVKVPAAAPKMAEEVEVNLPELADGNAGGRIFNADTIVPGVPTIGKVVEEESLEYQEKESYLLVPGYAVYVHTRPQ